MKEAKMSGMFKTHIWTDDDGNLGICQYRNEIDDQVLCVPNDHIDWFLAKIAQARDIVTE